MKRLEWLVTLILTLGIMYATLTAQAAHKDNQSLSAENSTLKSQIEANGQLIDSLSDELDELRGAQASDRQEVDSLANTVKDFSGLWRQMFGYEQEKALKGER